MGSESGHVRHLVIVDNDPVVRAGLRALLTDVAGVLLVDVVDHEVALGWDRRWAEADVVVVDAADLRRMDGDRFPGVAVVQTVRRHRSPDQTCVVVLTGHALHNGLRRRMREAGADYLYHRADGMTREELVHIVLAPEDGPAVGELDAELPASLGVTERTRVNEVLERLDRPDIMAALDQHKRKKSDPHGARSRWWDSVRALAGGSEGLTPVTAEGAGAGRSRLPSVPQIRRFLSAMTEP